MTILFRHANTSGYISSLPNTGEKQSKREDQVVENGRERCTCTPNRLWRIVQRNRVFFLWYFIDSVCENSVKSFPYFNRYFNQCRLKRNYVWFLQSKSRLSVLIKNFRFPIDSFRAHWLLNSEFICRVTSEFIANAGASEMPLIICSYRRWSDRWYESSGSSRGSCRARKRKIVCRERRGSRGKASNIPRDAFFEGATKAT